MCLARAATLAGNSSPPGKRLLLVPVLFPLLPDGAELPRLRHFQGQPRLPQQLLEANGTLRAHAGQQGALPHTWARGAAPRTNLCVYVDMHKLDVWYIVRGNVLQRLRPVFEYI